jgi:hypothetical protein
MFHALRLRLTYANLMATFAVFMALGGVSYAAIKIPSNSVGSKQLKKGAVTKAKLSSHTLKALSGKRGRTGATGPQGPKGAPGTPADLSTVYTKTESDGRFAPLSAVGQQLDLPGTAFHAINPATVVKSDDFFGVHESGTKDYLTADLSGLPRGATITDVEFLQRNNVAGTSEGNLSQGIPETGAEASYGQANVSDVKPDIVDGLLIPVGGAYTPAHNAIPILFWRPGQADPGDVLYGVHVHYTVK